MFPTYPAITNPVTLRTSAALPAAGAWDATPLSAIVGTTSRINLYFEYTRGAAGGAVDWKIETALPAGTEWYQTTIESPGIMVAGSDIQSYVQRNHRTYTSTGAAIERFVYGPIEIEAAEQFRVVARESGVVGNPGTFEVLAIIDSIAIGGGN